MFIATLLSTLFAMFIVLDVACASEKFSLEKLLIAEIKKLYGSEEEVLVQLHNIPREEKDVKRIMISRLPDRKGDGQALLELEEKSGKRRVAYVSFRVLTLKRFYILKRHMEKGETIRAEDIQESYAYLNDPFLYPSSAEEIIGKRLKRGVQGNTVITKDLLEDEYLIKRGDVVTVKLENEKMMVSTKAISLEKGKLGDTIRVKNMTSGKEIVGLISGIKEITVSF
ncbi:MAG: flagellar basal body P-ring formation chaperone FlgA [Deltaproteobacteria bacterium]|nr:flagellar basal body P-ring formation chaperone FlgA [Deltaproteobacteria bacterium]